MPGSLNDAGTNPRGQSVPPRGRHQLATVVSRVPPILIVYVVCVLLVYAVFIPTMSDIGGWDEAAYVNAGRLIAEQGTWLSIARGSLSGLLYAATYVLFRHSVYWMMYGVWVGRLASYTLIFFGTYEVARRLRQFASPVLVAFLFALSPFTLDFLIFPSDPLFAGMAALGLGQLLGYIQERRVSQLIGASAFVGLACFARPEGLVLSVCFLVALVVVCLAFRRSWQVLVPGLLPLVVVAGASALATGSILGGNVARAYANFESGHGVIYQGTGQMDRETEVHLEAERVYGTAEENNYSILRAIARRPDVYAQRLVAITKGFPQMLLHAYGLRYGVVLFLLALRGLIKLIRKRERLLLAVLCLWATPVATGFVITLFRTGHLLFPFYIVLALAGIGLAAMLEDFHSRRRWLAWVAVLAGFGVYGAIDNKLAITYGVSVFVIGLLAAVALPSVRRGEPYGHAQALLVLLCAGLIIRGSYPSPVIRSPGSDPIEQAVAYLASHYERNAPLAAGYPGIAWAARMTYVGLVDEDVPIDDTPRQFLQWMADQRVQAVFIDRTLFADNPAVWDLISPEMDKGLKTVFVTDGGDIQIAEITLDG
jgi:hypothetical protein